MLARPSFPGHSSSSQSHGEMRPPQPLHRLVHLPDAALPLVRLTLFALLGLSHILGLFRDHLTENFRVSTILRDCPVGLIGRTVV